MIRVRIARSTPSSPAARGGLDAGPQQARRRAARCRADGRDGGEERAGALAAWKCQHQAAEEQVAQLQGTSAMLNAQKARLVEGYLDEPIEPQTYRQQMDWIGRQLNVPSRSGCISVMKGTSGPIEGRISVMGSGGHPKDAGNCAACRARFGSCARQGRGPSVTGLHGR
jgi:hypothetical protein